MTKKLLFFFIAVGVFLSNSNAQTPTLAWAYQTSSTYSVEGISVAVDNQGYVYTTGNFKTQTDFDPGPDVFNLDVVQLGYSDIYITKMTPGGQLVWAKKVGGYYDDVASAIYLDKTGNILITGNFAGTSDFNPGAATNNLATSSSNNPDIFILKLDTAGNYVWARSLSGASTADAGLTIASDDQGNVYTGGTFGGTVDFDPGSGTANITGTGGTDVFISKLNASGAYIWGYKIGSTGADNLYSIHIDDEGKLLLTGSFTGTVDFNVSTTAANNLVSSGTTNPFILKMDQNAGYIWAKLIALFDSGYGNSITTDSANNVYVAGGFLGTGDFNPGTPTLYKTSLGANDIFVLKLDKNGNYVNMQQVGGTLNDNPNTIVADIAGNVFLTGNFSGTVDFNPAPGTGTTNVFNLTSVSSDMFLLKIDASGVFGFAYAISTANVDLGKYLALDPNGAVITIGRFQGTADFDPGAGVYNLSTALSNTYGAFVQKVITPIAVVPTTANISVKCLMEGYYSGSGLMAPVLNMQGVSTSLTVADSVTVRLHQAVSPYNEIFMAKVATELAGNASLVIPANLANGNFFISVSHRNSIGVWSSTPVQITNNLLYDFTLSPSNSFGNNVQLVDPLLMRYGLFSGDINQDGIVDGLDYNDWESDANNFGAGFISTDLNGDGVADGLDYNLFEVNNNNFAGVVQP